MQVEGKAELGLSKEMNKDKRRFLMIIRFTLFILQALCCVATFSSFSRLLDQYKLPKFFILVPGLLVFLAGLERCYLLSDSNLNSIIRGSVTGFLSGFYATVVNDNFTHSFHTMHNKFLISLGQYELLNIPVICGAIMCIVFITFINLPPLRIVILSFALAICSMALFSVGTILFSSKPETALINQTQVFLVFISVFMFGLFPFISFKQRLCLFSTLIFFFSVLWQFYQLDSAQWEWRLNRFPVPGSCTAIIFLFLFDIVQFHTSKDNEIKISNKKRKRQSNVDNDDDKYALYYEETDENDSEDLLSNALTWHCVCYVLERTTLTLIMEKQHKRKFLTDTWLCSLCILYVYLIYVNYKQLSVLSKMLLTYLGLAVYFCIGITNGLISNGYFIDSVFGILFLMISTMNLED